MNKKNLLYLGTVLFLICLSLQGCKQKDVEVLSPSLGNFIYFERESTIDGKSQRVDTLSVSFSHYVGQDKISFPFKVKLIGDLLKEDKEYKVKVVGDLTTAKPEQYSYSDKLIFRKGVVADSMYITIFRDKLAKDEEVVLTLGIEANDNFGIGYVDCQTIKLRFNNKIVKPLWWVGDIEKVFFGKYSYKKYSTIIEANPGFVSVVGMSQTEIREIALNTKDYILANGTTEEDDTAMVIPIY